MSHSFQNLFERIEILFEDADLAVVHKPSGLVVNRSETVKEPTLQDWWEAHLREQPMTSETAAPATTPEALTSWQEMVPSDFPHEYGSPEEIFAERGGIVHRLDRETSGAIVLAKNPGALANLLRQFRVRDVQKKYMCLVHGKFAIEEDTVSLPLARSSQNRTRFAVDTEGRGAETRYKVKTFYPQLNVEKVMQHIRQEEENEARRWAELRKKLRKGYQGFSFVECWPKTGRTHQIRVHMAHLHHPIVSDLTYLGKKRQSLDVLWCPRLFLHAAEVEFSHPRTAAPLQFSADLPQDLQDVFTYLE